MLRRLSAIALLLLLTGCSPTSIERHTADLTAASKRGAGAVARGVFAGLLRKGPINLNTATPAQLRTLPGITPTLADVIVAGRPYKSTKDLVRRKILSKDAFEAINKQVVVE